MPPEKYNTPPKIVIVSQMFYPDAAATAKVMADIALHLASNGFSVEVICQDRSYLDASIQYPERENWNGIEISRVQLPCLDKNSLLQRIWLLVRFSLGAYRKLRISNGSLFFAVSNPPWMGFLASRAAEKKKKPFVFLLHDLYPDILARLGKLSESSWIYRLSRWITRKTFNGADKIIVLGRDTKHYLLEHYNVRNEKLEIIPNWGPDSPDHSICSNSTKESTPNEKPFRVVYSGNLGETAEFETLLLAAEICITKGKDLEFIILGNGKKQKWLKDQIEARHLTNLMLMEFLPETQYREFLASASAFFVSLGKDLKGISVPSKTYTYLAAGKPVLALVPEGSEIALAIGEDGFGTVVPYDPSALADAILSLKNSAEVYEKQKKAAEKSGRKYSRSSVIHKYGEIIGTLISEWSDHS